MIKYVIHHESYGVLLGLTTEGPLWGKFIKGWTEGAMVFDKDRAQALLDSFATEEIKAKMVEVHSSMQNGRASADDCANANLPRWEK